MDCQFICNASGASTYACMYCSKAEAPDKNIIDTKVRNMLVKEKSVGVKDSVQKQLFITSMAVYNSREVCLQEMCWYLLGYPFVFSSRKFVKINLLPVGLQASVLKPAGVRSKLNEDEPAFYSRTEPHPLVIAYMELLPGQNELVDLSLYDFCSQYSITRGKIVLPNELVSADGYTRYRKRTTNEL
jgi:hypothetical protein